MTPRPTIFISSVSSELKSARQLVANTLQFLGYEPVWQDIFGSEQGDLREMLRRKIDACDGVVQLIGHRYGAEPPRPDETFGRVSYTQYEALYARQRGRKVWYLFLDKQFPSETVATEPEELRELQATYRRRLQSESHLYHPLHSREALEANVLKMRDDLAGLRRGVKRWAVAVATLLVVITVITLLLFQRQRETGRQMSEAAKQVSETARQQGAVIEEIKTEVKKDKPLPTVVTAVDLPTALAAADFETLKKSGATAKQLENAFAKKQQGAEQTVARQFFESSRNSPEAIEWLKQALADGLDPNVLIPDPYFERRAILTDALKAGNASATLALLEAGASPHPYQGLWLAATSEPIYIWPYGFLAESARFTHDEKVSIAKVMHKSGAVLPRITPDNPVYSYLTNWQRPNAVASTERNYNETRQRLDNAVEATEMFPTRAPSPIAVWAKKRTGFDWVKLVESVPKGFKPEENSRGDTDLHDFRLYGLIGVVEDKACFLAFKSPGWESVEYCLIEVSKDLRQWAAYVNCGGRAGGGLCKTQPGDNYRPERCWKRLSMTYNPQTKQLLVEGYYKYEPFDFTL